MVNAIVVKYATMNHYITYNMENGIEIYTSPIRIESEPSEFRLPMYCEIVDAINIYTMRLENKNYKELIRIYKSMIEILILGKEECGEVW